MSRGGGPGGAGRRPTGGDLKRLSQPTEGNAPPVLALVLATLTPLVLGLILLATEALDRRSPEDVGPVAPARQPEPADKVRTPEAKTAAPSHAAR